MRVLTYKIKEENKIKLRNYLDKKNNEKHTNTKRRRTRVK